VDFTRVRGLFFVAVFLRQKLGQNKYWFFLQKPRFSLTKLLPAFNFLAIVDPKVEDY
jgi:hypothetical protein